MKFQKIACFPLFVGLLLIAQGNTVKDLPVFRSPVDGALRLSGSFGELRSNHFHAGIDIKSHNGSVGQPIYACEDGYVSRIKIQSGGYGNAIYITHPNGYTTVYAHLHAFSDKITAYTRTQQYQQKAFEIDVHVPLHALPVRKSDVIGKMGTSGRSFGPHLHFEVRETSTEKVVNPLLFGITMTDHRAPIINALKVYHLSKPLFRTLHAEEVSIYKSGAEYRVRGDTLTIDAWRIGFGVKTYDLMPRVSNWNGVYAIRTLLDGRSIHEFQMDGFHFDETRYINAHIDYAEEFGKKSFYNHTFQMPGSRLSAIRAEEGGVIELFERKAQQVEIICEDAAGNSTRLRFWVKRSPRIRPPQNLVYQYKLPYDEEHLIKREDIRVFLPKGCLYRTLFMRYSRSDDRSDDHRHSYVHHIHDDYTPTHRYYTLAIKPTHLPEALLDKAFIAYCSSKGSVLNCGGQWNGDFLQTEVRDFGNFCILTDEEPPTIEPIAFSSNMRSYNRMKFKIKDNYKSARNAPGLRYHATIDGQWILMEYDEKNDLVYHYFDDERMSSGNHQFVLTVTDGVGNTTVFERTFVR